MVDNWVQRAVLIIAAILAFMFGATIIWIAIQVPARNVPDVVQIGYTGATGFIFGMLVNMRTGAQPEEPPQRVEVVNRPNDPVPTDQVATNGGTAAETDVVGDL